MPFRKDFLEQAAVEMMLARLDEQNSKKEPDECAP
jgi:hypothetical protein